MQRAATRSLAMDSDPMADKLRDALRPSRGRSLDLPSLFVGAAVGFFIHSGGSMWWVERSFSLQMNSIISWSTMMRWLTRTVNGLV